MDRKKLLKRIAYLILIIFLLNFLAGKFYWYSTIWYFDMPMHFLGGFWLGLMFFLIFIHFQPKLEPKLGLLIKVILGVLLIGILWELFELVFYNYIGKNPFNTLDTMSDICFDLAGGLSSIFYVSKRIMPEIINEV